MTHTDMHVEDSITVMKVDVEYDYDSIGDHAPSEVGIEDLAGGGAGYLRVRFWRNDPGNSGYQSFDLAGCDVTQALEWAYKHTLARGGEFYRATFQLGVFIKDYRENDESRELVIWVYGDNPLQGTYEPTRRMFRLGTTLAWIKQAMKGKGAA